MIHRFSLAEVSKEEFNSNCTRHGISPDESKTNEGKNKRYFSLKDYVAVKTPKNFLDESDHESLRALIFPDVNAAGKKRIVRSRDSSIEHCLGILENMKADWVRIELSKLPFSKGKYADEFELRKINNGDKHEWILMYMHIRDKNFGLYEFDGHFKKIDSKETHSISGIYLG